MLDQILDRVEEGRRLEARRLTDLAANQGGPLYANGRAMARTIDQNLGAAPLARAGVRALMRDDLEGAIEALGEAVRFDSSGAVSACHLACVHALQAERQETLPWRPIDFDRHARGGSRRKALRWVDEALWRGFNDFRQVRVDPDLASLHDDPGFQVILQNYGIDSRPGADDR